VLNPTRSGEETPVLPMRPELLKGHLDALLLAVLEPGPQHGYAVIEALRSGSNGTLDLPTGTVYPALHRLERAGLIASDWQTVGGRRRRAYHLTSAGHAALGEQRAIWDQFSTAVTTVLTRRTWPATA
jgi:DNA-binding PadR family transcriptional regulator